MTCDVRGICDAQATEPGSDEMKTAILRGTGGDKGVTSIFKKLLFTVMFLSFRTDRSGQTMQTQIRLLLEE